MKFPDDLTTLTIGELIGLAAHCELELAHVSATVNTEAIRGWLHRIERIGDEARKRDEAASHPAPPGDVPDKIRELIEDDIAECYAITGNRDCPDCAEMRKWLESFHATPAPQPVAPRPDWSQERSIAEAEAIAAEFHHLSGTLQQILRNDIVDLLNKMKADYEAALVPPPVAPVPRWEDAPEGAMWAVIDGDMDNWVWCTQEPTLGFTRDMGWEWDFGEGWDHGNYAHTPIGTDWRTLKFRRPQAQPEPPHA